MNVATSLLILPNKRKLYAEVVLLGSSMYMQIQTGHFTESFGELFFSMVDEIADVSFNHAVTLITDLLLQSVKESFGFTDSQLDMLADNFYRKLLPCYQRGLKRAA